MSLFNWLQFLNHKSWLFLLSLFGLKMECKRKNRYSKLPKTNQNSICLEKIAQLLFKDPEQLLTISKYHSG